MRCTFTRSSCLSQSLSKVRGLQLILIDSRVGSADLIDYPPLNSPHLTQLCTLDSADVCFTGFGPNEQRILIGIEVKSIPDLLASRRNGRLFGTQIPKMCKGYQRSYFILYGGYRCNDLGQLEIESPNRRHHSEWSTYPPDTTQPTLYSEFESSLIIMQHCGISTKHVYPDFTLHNHTERITSCKHQIARYIYTLYAKWQKPYAQVLHTLSSFDKSQRLPKVIADLPTFAKSAKSRDTYTARECVAEIAKDLPGIGQTRAWAVADTFDSPLAMFSAPESAWLKVPGIAARTASKVYGWIRRSKLDEKS